MPTQPSSAAPTAPDSARDVSRRAPLHLKIAGNGLLLNGRFEHWVPVVMDATRDNDGSAQLLVDVTSITSPSRVSQPDLFSFSSRKVKAEGPMAFTAHGTLQANGVERAAQAFIQAPDLHTPFFLLTFSVPRQEFPELWKALEDGVNRKDGNDPGEVRASAWLRPPDVAAA